MPSFVMKIFLLGFIGPRASHMDVPPGENLRFRITKLDASKSPNRPTLRSIAHWIRVDFSANRMEVV
jgi:hypothetical protein